MAFKIYPYNQGSRSARALADALGGRVLRREGSTYRYRPQDTIINWGASITMNDGLIRGEMLNHEDSVSLASNKLHSFREFQRAGVSIPRFWTNPAEIPDDAFPIVCRTILQGHSGAGIVIAATRADLVRAPLYVEYKKKQEEYRIHVGRIPGEYPGRGNYAPPAQDQSIIIAQQQKRRRQEVENPNWQVRNHQNGFVFARENVAPPLAVITEATRAIAALGLDFGAVDVIWNSREERAYVLEVNTACGLEGQTVTDYANFFRRFVR